MRRVTTIAALIAVIWAHPSHADELQDRIEAAIEAFGGIVPHAPDVGLGWADMVIRGAVDQSNPSSIIASNSIGDWLISNQPSGVDAQYMQRVEWVGSTFKTVMGKNTRFTTAHPTEQISVADLHLRIVAAVDKVTPGKSVEQLAAEQLETAELMRKGAEEQESKRWAEQRMLNAMRRAEELEAQWPSTR